MEIEKNEKKPNYGNWVATRLIYGPVIFGLGLLAIGIFIHFFIYLAIPFLLIAAYFAYARHAFAPDGGNVQEKIQALVFDYLNWDGKSKALDIGCGSGSLTISLAKHYPTAQVTGIDTWGAQWEYSKTVCEKNAQLEGVAEHVTFQKASASVLPFKNDEFDAAVSNLVFHEIKAAKDKKKVLREALRVVRKGGSFAFQDLFLIRSMYGEIDDLLVTILSWGISSVHFVATNQQAFIPRALKLPFMVGTIGIIYGVK